MLAVLGFGQPGTRQRLRGPAGAVFAALLGVLPDEEVEAVEYRGEELVGAGPGRGFAFLGRLDSVGQRRVGWEVADKDAELPPAQVAGGEVGEPDAVAMAKVGLDRFPVGAEEGGEAGNSGIVTP